MARLDLAYPVLMGVSLQVRRAVDSGRKSAIHSLLLLTLVACAESEAGPDTGALEEPPNTGTLSTGSLAVAPVRREPPTTDVQQVAATRSTEVGGMGSMLPQPSDSNTGGTANTPSPMNTSQTSGGMNESGGTQPSAASEDTPPDSAAEASMPEQSADASVGSVPQEVPPPTPLAAGELGVLCEDRNSGQTQAAQFSIALSIANTGQAVSVQSLSVRYYFTQDESSADGHLVFIDDAGPSFGLRDAVTHRVVEMTSPAPGADHYVELSFQTAFCAGEPCEVPAGTVDTPGFDARPVQLRVQIDPSALRYDLTDDYSYTPEARELQLCSRITLYQDGVLIYGTEPGATSTDKADAGPSDAGSGEVPDAGASEWGPDEEQADAAPPQEGATQDAAASRAADASAPEVSALDAAL